MANYDKSTYWAAETDSKVFVERALVRIRNYRDWLSSTGRTDRMIRAWQAFYGYGPDGTKSASRLMRGGAQGELVLATANLFAVLVRQTMRLLTGTKAAFKAIPNNTDAAAVAEGLMAEALLEHYDRKVLLQEVDNDAVLSGLLLGSGWEVYSWGTQLGEEIGLDPDTQKVIREGDVVARSLLPWDVAIDPRDADAQRQWFAFRVPVKRHDLIAQYPEMADELVLAKAIEPGDSEYPLDDARRAWDETGDDEDNLLVWEVRHIPTAACPAGRLVRFVSAKCVLFDSGAVKLADGESTANAGFPYPDLLAYEFCPERQVGRSAGHSSHFDNLSLQELLDLLTTTVASNVNIGGLLNVWSPSEPNITRLSTGFNVISSAVKPEVIDLMKIPPELMAFGEAIQKWMQQLVGLNDVVMGDTTKGMPAQLAALLEAKSVQYHQQGQAAYYRLVEKSRTGLLKMLSRFVQAPRVAQLVGKSGSWMQQQWRGDDVASVERIVVEPLNPVMRTFAGKMQLAGELADRFPDRMTYEDYVAVWLTGNLNQKMDAPKAHLGRLAREKELLMAGIGLPPVDMEASLAAGAPVFVDDGQEHIRPLASDRHWVDIPEMLSVLESPEARENPAVVKAVTEVVQEKLRLWREMDPDLLAIMGGPPAPSSMQMPAMPPPPESKSLGGKSPSAEASKLEPSPDVKMPAPPPNPMTGEQAPPNPVPQA